MSSGLTPAEIAVALKINTDTASLDQLRAKLEATKARLQAMDMYPMENTTRGLGAAAVAAGNTEAQFLRAERATTLLGAGFTRMIPGTGMLGTNMAMLGRGVAEAGASFGLLNAVMIGVGIAGVVAMGAAVYELTTKGVQLNETLEKTKEIVASNLLGEAGSTYGGASGAQNAASAAMQELVDASNNLSVPISKTADMFGKLNAESTLSGASLEKQVALVTSLVAAQSQLGLSTQKITSDVQQLLNGRVTNNNQLAQELNLTKQEVLSAREHGTVVELITGKVKEQADEYKNNSTSFDVASQKLQASFEMLALKFAQPIMGPLTDATNKFAQTLGSGDMQAAFENFGEHVVKMMGVLGQLVDVLGNADNAIQKFENALDKAWDDTIGKSWGDVVKKQQEVIDKARSEEKQSVLDNLGVGAGFDGVRVATAPRQFPKSQIQQKISYDPAGYTTNPPVQDPVGGYPKTPKGPKDHTDSEDQKEIAAIQSQINEEQSKYNLLVEKAKVDHELGKTSLDQQYASTIQASTAYSKSLDDGIARLQQMIAKVQAVGAAHGGLNAVEEKQVNNLQKAVNAADLLKEKLQLINAQNTGIGQWTISMQKFTDSLQLTGTKAAQVFQGEITTAIDGVTKGLTDLIFNSKNVGQAFAQMGESMVEQLLKVMVQQIAFNALHRSLAASQVQQDAGTAASGAYSAMASIPYVGPILGAIAAAAAYAGVIAFETFETGGIVGGGYSKKDNRVAMVRSGEGILTPEAVHSIGGPSTVHAINRMEFAGGFAYGGVVDSPSAITPSFAKSASGGRDVHVNLFHSMDDLSNHMWSHPDVEHNVLKVVKKGRNTIKV